MQCHITYDSDIAQDLKNILEVDDLDVVLSSEHRPRCIIQFISQSLQLLDVESTKRQMLVSSFEESCKHYFQLGSHPMFRLSELLCIGLKIYMLRAYL